MRKWDQLPENMKNDAIRPYYEYLQQHKKGLIAKRIFDVLMALILLLIFWPILLILGILVGSTSKGGVFFRQERVTTYGRTFQIFKFRTMVADAEKKGSQVTTSGDARVTPIGRFLRKVRLDELPQLFNILSGDMSFVGTRPEVPRYVEAYSDEMRATLLLPAGVTSKASIEYKDEERLLSAGTDVDATYIHEVLPGKMKYNLDYLKTFSFGKDILLMVQTVLAVIR